MGGSQGKGGVTAVVIFYETTTPKPYVMHTQEVLYDRPNAGGAGDLVGFLHAGRISTQMRAHLRPIDENS
jgi:hypothetical protein